MALTPLDIHNKEFARRWRGYNPNAVDEFLDQVIREFDALIRENNAFKEQVESMAGRLQQYEKLEDTLNRTLIIAQQTADDLKAIARKEADLIIQEARAQAERIVADGQRRVQSVLAEKDQLQQVVETLRTQVRSLLKAQIETLDARAIDIDQHLSGISDQLDPSAAGAGAETASDAAEEPGSAGAPAEQAEQPAAERPAAEG